ncbi:MAG: hypothetical protein MUF86_05980 [Akkermansiaceae bacterium]|nr:hypothetical protein [Akkermansiaceae bacterium]MCU0777199.1 hypothetical protein [Akkermansiaceae bacterium]
MSVPDAEPTLIPLLIYATIGLLLLLLFLAWRLMVRLGRIERTLAGLSSHAEQASDAPPSVESQPGGAFEAFLLEDPERRKLPKGEQFAAYRRWRQEKGLNWSNS